MSVEVLLEFPDLLLRERRPLLPWFTIVVVVIVVVVADDDVILTAVVYPRIEAKAVVCSVS